MTLIESLERRELFSVSVKGTDVVITGTAGPDNTYVSYHVDKDRLTVFDNGVEKKIEGARNSKGIRRIVWKGLGSRDEFRWAPASTQYYQFPVLADGGEGNDYIKGGNSGDTLMGGSGNDVLEGESGNDTLKGGVDDDVLTGDAGADTLSGESGADRIYARYLGDIDTIYLDGLDQIVTRDRSDRIVRQSQTFDGAVLRIDRSLGAGDESRMEKGVFYPAWYLAKYPDLSLSLGSGNIDGAIRHWIDHGIREGRMPNPYFHAVSYLARWDDLRAAFGNNAVAATQHWVNDGIKEGRDGSPGLVQGRDAQNIRLRSSASLLALDVDTNMLGLGGKVQVWQSHGELNQNWDLLAQDDGTYIIRSRINGLVLDADYYSLGANGTRVHMWEYNGGRHQHWRLELTLDGSYIIRNAASGRALDVEATQQGVNGGRMQLWDYIGGANQRWRIA